MKPEYSALELKQLVGISKEGLRKKAAKKGWRCREESNGNGGGVCRYYAVESMDQEFLLKLSMAEAAQSGEQLPVPVKPAAIPSVPAVQQAVSVKPSPPGTIIPEHAKKIALARYRLVHAWREVCDRQPWGMKDDAGKAFLIAYNSGAFMPDVWKTLGQVKETAVRRFDTLLRKYNDDYFAIADGRGGWRLHGTNKWKKRQLRAEAQQALLNSWLHPNQPKVSVAIKASRMILAKFGISEESDDSTWRRWLGEWAEKNAHVVTMAREGYKAYVDKWAPYITRDASLLEPGQCLVADGHPLNFPILHPDTGRPCRMPLILFYDWASRDPVGWQIMPTENTIAIMSAFKNAIMYMGKLPQAVYLDNGKAFKSRVFTQTDPDLEELTGLYARLGVATCFAKPYNARSKIVERFFLTLSNQCERLLPCYTGASIEDKPAWMLRNEKFHKAWHDAVTQGWIPNIREASQIISAYFAWFREQEHRGLRGQTPAEVMARGFGPGVDVAEINREFMWRVRIPPRRCRVTLWGIDYESDCLHGIAHDVIVFYDTAHLEAVFIHDLNGNYMGDARPVQALHPLAKLFGDEVSVDQVKKAIEHHRKLARNAKDQLIELGVGSETVEGLNVLPWNKRVSVITGGKTEDAGPKMLPEKTMPEDERRRLELVVSRAEAEIAANPEPAIERPEYFFSEVARYDWCWQAKHKHRQALSGEDDAFMAYFEKTDDFTENYQGRYADLAELYGVVR